MDLGESKGEGNFADLGVKQAEALLRLDDRDRELDGLEDKAGLKRDTD